MVNWYTIIIVIILLVTLDKTLTVLNINAVKKNNPGVDPLSIERNPIAKWCFQKTGLLWGSVLYGIFSIGTFLLAMWLFSYPARAYAPDNAWGVSFYAMCMFYGFVIMNNFYFFLRYNKLL
jgi:hypothetical protein